MSHPMTSHSQPPLHSVAVVGAGFGGIATAIALKKQGVDDFIILEKASGVGGTWKANTYPGASSDIAIHLYSLSTDLKHDWDNSLEPQPKILEYMEAVVQRHGLASDITFNAEVLSAKWDPEAQMYEITTQDTITGAPTIRLAKIIVSAHGILHIPKFPNIPGLDGFQGRVMHSAQWDTTVDLKGKRVAVIGNGASAAQIMSRIPKIEGIQVTQFMRTRNWHLPTPFRYIKVSAFKWLFMTFPFLSYIYRFLAFCFFEFSYFPIFRSTAMRPYVMKAAKYYVSIMAPKEYHSTLIPSFPVGCKRIVYDPGYLELLGLPNISLKEGTDIASVHSEGIITTSGELLPFDVIVLATGFITDTFPYLLRGSTDSTIEEFYDENGGPQAYLGTTVPGFPNFYLISGPNTATGYTSVLIFTEIQVAYIMKLIKPIINKTASSFEVTLAAHNAYNKKIQGFFKDAVFFSCSSWYRAGGDGRIVSIFPGSSTLFRWWCRSVNWSDYTAIGSKPRQNDWLNGHNFAMLVCAAFGFLALQHWLPVV